MDEIRIGEQPEEEEEERPRHRVHEHLFAYQSPSKDGSIVHADFKDKSGKVLFSQDYANIAAYWRHVEELRAFHLKRKEQQEEKKNERTTRNQGSE